MATVPTPDPANAVRHSAANADVIGTITRIPGDNTRLTTSYFRAEIVVEGDFLPTVLQAAGVAAEIAIRATIAAEVASGVADERSTSLADPKEIRRDEDHLRRCIGIGGGTRSLVAITPRIGCPRFYAFGTVR